MPARALLVATAASLALTGCGGASSSGSSPTVAIKAGDKTCDVATTTFASGSIRFAVQNVGKDTTEVYVYGKGSSGDFDKVVGEVENIAPGISREFSVKVSGGAYEVACKPGQTGAGVRTEITVAGAAASADSAYDRQVDVTAKEYAFTGLDGLTAKVGEKVEFKLENASTSMQHELEFLGPDGKNVGEVGPTDAGKGGEVIITFAVAGTYTYLCGLSDHATRGMKGTITVA